ncbi:hypothetical protein BGZ76_001848 [Entomortierella beljakovae]|nr:hypothetical protein BGZ76_001848 [Entomortierella beljakovae]
MVSVIKEEGGREKSIKDLGLTIPFSLHHLHHHTRTHSQNFSSLFTIQQQQTTQEDPHLTEISSLINMANTTSARRFNLSNTPTNLTQHQVLNDPEALKVEGSVNDVTHEVQHPLVQNIPAQGANNPTAVTNPSGGGNPNAGTSSSGGGNPNGIQGA